MTGLRPGRRDVLSGLCLLAATAVGAVRFGGSAAAREPAAAGPGPETGSAPRELRGMWIASVENIDWPAASGLSADRLRADFTDLLDHARTIGLNAVFVQVRPTADAFWPSPFEPWSQWLTGVQGVDPGWDPLDFMVEAAHRRGLAFHAWFNPYRVSTQPDPGRLAADHPARLNPHWAVAYDGRLYYDPGLPEVRRFVQRAMMDAVTRYELDGVHFDDYFYPYPVAGQDFPDGATFAEHGAGFADRAAWRRHNVDLLVAEMSDLVRAARPEAAFGISPFGVWRNARSDPDGSDTAALQSYDALHADTLHWIRSGWLDYVAPQLYWPIGFAAADYATLAPWWAARTAGTDTQLWIGQAVSRVGSPTPAGWQDPQELSRHLTLNAGLPQIGGNILFSANHVRADRLGAVSLLVADHWARPALTPVLPRLSAAPGPPAPLVSVTGSGPDGLPLVFRGAADSTPFQYAVYGPAAPGPTSEADAAGPVAVVPGPVGRFTLADVGEAWRYAVTAVDRAGRESPATPVVRLSV
ncbi:glycoside hydrolase family 10 protein [Kitasatospora sp. NBC_00374]|uniref:glycoside hydrolase family 10 protein n=1 Tax=Kitasatospora sp. NBC_00374 TaxID=2975964 RepID=UPI00352C2F7C